MPSRSGLFAALAALVLTSAVLLAGTRAPAGQVRDDITAALADGRTDEALVVTALDAVSQAEGSGTARQLAVALERLGRVYSARGEFMQATRALERAIAASAGEDATIRATFLEQLADGQLHAGSYDAAEGTIASLRAIRDTQPADTLGQVRLLELDATLQTRRDRYAAARETVDRALAMMDATALPAERLASLRFLSGDLAYLMGDIRRAGDEYEAALATARRAFGERHPAIVPYIGRVAVARVAAGDVGAARDLRLQSLALAQASLPRCHPEAIATLNDLALSDEFFGDYVGARQLMERALMSARECLGETHSLTAQTMANLGLIVLDLGDLAEAERLQRDAVAAWTASRGPTHSFVAIALEQLADVVAARGRLDEALRLYQRVLEMRTQALGEVHPAVARVLTLRAGVLAQQKKLTAATRDLDRAAVIYQRGAVGDEPEALSQVQMLLLRGDIERALGHPENVRQAYAAALAIREDVFGPSHPLVAEVRSLVAAADLVLGDSEQAFAEALNGETAARAHIRQTMRYLTERQALEYASLKPRALDVMVAVAGHGSDAMVTAAFDALIRSRAVVLDELAARARLAGRVPSGATDVMTRFVSARQRYANLIVQSLRERVPRERIDAARMEAETAEARVAEQNATTREERARADAGLNDVRAALPSRTALVAFIRYEPPAVAGAVAVSRYGAFVIGGESSTPAFVPIGSAAHVEALVRAWRAEVSRRPGPGGTPIAAGTALRKAVWDPIATRAGDVTRVFIVPDGALNVVNFAALPRVGGGYLVEDARTIHYLSSERDLLVPREPPLPAVLVVGGPAFTGSRNATVAATVRAGADCRGSRPLAFSELPGTRLEAAEVSSLWSRSVSGDVVVLSGTDATETAVKAALSGRRVIHLATHGFFLGSDCESRNVGTRSIGGVVAANAAPAQVLHNPLLLAGLALAGANGRVAAGGDDGILTAEEIASLDLHGTEWAVLSACDTGLGEIRSGEGVLGLRRAFQIAGARTVIMSLWSVDDQATRRWMQALYDARLRRGLDTADAVRAASVEMLTLRRASGLSTHPFYWAAFVAAGDWR